MGRGFLHFPNKLLPYPLSQGLLLGHLTRDSPATLGLAAGAPEICLFAHSLSDLGPTRKVEGVKPGTLFLLFFPPPVLLEYICCTGGFIVTIPNSLISYIS
jgi:hypothetical protein